MYEKRKMHNLLLLLTDLADKESNKWPYANHKPQGIKWLPFYLISVAMDIWDKWMIIIL